MDGETEVDNEQGQLHNKNYVILSENVKQILIIVHSKTRFLSKSYISTRCTLTSKGRNTTVQ
jgi:hypothetical protein